jgi:hypothetical protein
VIWRAKDNFCCNSAILFNLPDPEGRLRALVVSIKERFWDSRNCGLVLFRSTEIGVDSGSRADKREVFKTGREDKLEIGMDGLVNVSWGLATLDPPSVTFPKLLVPYMLSIVAVFCMKVRLKKLIRSNAAKPSGPVI